MPLVASEVGSVSIYGLFDPRSETIRYVGKSIDPKIRLLHHIRHSRSNTHKNAWLKSLCRDGLVPLVEVLETCSDENWQEAERFWIAYLKMIGCPLTNAETGGHGGKRLSEETKQKLRVVNIGHLVSNVTRLKISSAMKGKKLSIQHRTRVIAALHRPCLPETRRRIGIANSGKKPSAETRAKLSAARKGRPCSNLQQLIACNTGRPCSVETRAKISLSNKGRNKPSPTAEHRAKISASLLGITRNAETRAKMSAAKKQQIQKQQCT